MLAWLLACTPGSDSVPSPKPAPTDIADDTATMDSGDEVKPPLNVLLLLADDLGIDKLGIYDVVDDVPPTPNLDALAARGLTFHQAYANPVCSPTRATILTGRHNTRYGLGQAIIVSKAVDYLPTEEFLLPERLASAGVTSIATGKWHLSGKLGLGMMHPLLQGFAHHRGAPGNLSVSWSDIDPSGYYHYDYAIDGVLGESTIYATTQTVDDTLTLLADTPEPWFSYVAFNAPHHPWHKPPAALHSYDLDGAGTRRKFDASVEALDTEIGRLLAGIDPEQLARTVVLFLGDNGTPSAALADGLNPFRAKATLYQLGIHVPLIIAGPGIPVGHTDALVQALDLYPTIVDWEQADRDGGLPIDGISMLPIFDDPDSEIRRHIVMRFFGPNFTSEPTRVDEAVAFDAHHKYMIDRLTGREQFFDLSLEYDDGPDLSPSLTPNQVIIRDGLRQLLDDHIENVPFEYDGYQFQTP